ncbi:MAG: hypothetical protein KatS3mg011_1718 [Acidimicrobiia bacterium]|nr:MAG: hypothetical protein KatS3mg011_1718 [Acidimicrobiia bacterium]
MDAVVRWLHLVAASVWLGGLITVGALVPALRRAGATREMLQAMARRFGTVSWTALGVAAFTGAWQAVDHLGSPVLVWKVGLVALAAGLALWHQAAARDQSPAVRGAIQGAILLVSLAIFAVAVRL